jgi:glutamate synthase (NADPH/NADH) small chain
MQANEENPEILDRRRKVLLPFLDLDFRSAQKRILDFREVTIPFDVERAKYEALRCIDCPDPPCVGGCPVRNDIPYAMTLASQGLFVEAGRVFLKTSNMPEVCGRVCPQEQLCQGSCVLNHSGEPVLIGAVEAYVTDILIEEAPPAIPISAYSGKRVAVLGAGPAGLSCAEQLALKGHSVTIFEGNQEGGGLLLYGIPGFKLNPNIVNRILERIKAEGVQFKTGICIGEDKTIDNLLEEGFDAVFIGIGAGIDSPIKVPGEDLPGVYHATEFLLRSNVDFSLLPHELRALPEVGNRVIVIGGGDTSADCVRSAKRLGAGEVICAYRRTESEMPGVTKDRKLAKEEGVEYRFLTQPVQFFAGSDGKISEVECVKMELGEADSKGRRRPVPVENSNFKIPVDTVILAIGYQPYPTIGDTTPGLETHHWGLITVDENFATTRKGVFAGGDAVNGPDLVVTAIADARQAAEAIDRYLAGI